MRSFFLSFICAWFVGILAKQYNWDIRLFILTVGIIALVLVWRKNSTPFIVTVCCLAILGFFRVDTSHSLSEAVCTKEIIGAQGVVTRVLKGNPDTQRLNVEVSPDCLVLVSMAPFPTIRTGDIVIVESGKVQTMSEQRQRAPEYAQYLDRQGVSATVDFPQVRVIEHRSQPLTAFRDSLEVRINKVFLEPEASLINGMLLAKEDHIPEEIISRFQHTGVSHILAISGSNISLLAIILIAIIWLVPISPLVATVIVAVCMWIYIVVIGMPTSALRAVIFWTLALLAYQGRRLTNLPSILGIAVLCMVSINPSIIQDIGFQLSVAAVTGIGLTLFIFQKWPKRSGLRFILQSAAITFGASVATWPIAAYHFGTLSLIGLLVNAFIVPLTAVFIVLALGTLLISFVVPPLGIATSFFVHIVWQLMDVITRVALFVPYGYFENLSWSVTGVGIYYGLITALSIWWMRWHKRSWREIWA